MGLAEANIITWRQNTCGQQKHTRSAQAVDRAAVACAAPEWHQRPSLSSQSLRGLPTAELGLAPRV